MSFQEKHDNLLEAASRIVRGEGFLNLTLERVANEAGVSKGGLLHYFPNKEALIKGLLSYLNEQFVSKVKERAKNDTNPVGRWNRAYILEIFDHIKNDTGMFMTLLASAAISPSLLNELQFSYEDFLSYIEQDQIDPVTSTIILLATDGLFFSEILGLAPLDEEMLQKVKQKLICLTETE